MSINWEHPDVHALILQKLQNDPGALTQAQIAERASIILQRKIQPTNIQRRLTSLKNKLQNQENVSTTARLAPYTKNPPKQQKTVSDMSNRSLLGKIDEAFTELKNRINIEDVGIADSVTKQASSNLDSFFASPVRPKDGFVWEFNGLEAEKRKAEYKEGENVEYRKLYGCNTGWLDYEDENVAVFCTDRSYRILANCRIIVGDATFSTSPKGVYQTFYIHFRALSVLLCGDESYHGEVRAAVCSFIAEDISIDETKHIFTNARAIAAAKLQINTSQPIMDRRYWMNDADLAAAAALLQCNIFDKDHQLQYEGKCRLRIDRLSELLLVEPDNEECKMKSAMFKWNFIMDKNILFVFGEHELNDFALVFDGEKRCKKVYDFICKDKTKEEVEKEMLYNRFLIPACNQIIHKNDETSKLKKIITKWINKHGEEAKKVYVKILKDNNAYDIVYGANQNLRNLGKRRRPDNIREYAKSDHRDKSLLPKKMKCSKKYSKTVDRTEFKLVNFKPRHNQVFRRLIIFTESERSHCYEYSWSRKKKFYRCVGCNAKSRGKDITAIFDKDENGIEYIKLEDKEHICTPIAYNAEKYIEMKVFKKPDYEILEGCNRTTGKLLILFDENDRSQCWEFRANTNNPYFNCRHCATSAKIWNENTEDEYVELWNANHKCKTRPYNPQNHYGFNDFVLSPDFEMRTIFWDGEERKRLIIFDKNDRTLCYVFSAGDDERFHCSGCRPKGLTISAKLSQNLDGEDYVLLSSTRHLCELRPYAKLFEKETVLREPDFKIMENSVRKKIFIFDSNNRNLCYIFSLSEGSRYYCIGCHSIRIKNMYQKNEKINQLFIQLCKDEIGEYFVQLSERQHICKPRNYEPEKFEKKEIQKCYDYFFFRFNKYPSSVSVALSHPENKALCFKFWYNKSGSFFTCTGCKSTGNYINTKLEKDENGKEYFLHDYKKHVCKPIKISSICKPLFDIIKRNDLEIGVRKEPEVDESRIVKSPNFRLLPNRKGTENGSLFVFHSEDKNFGYKYFYSSGDKFYSCCRVLKDRCRAIAKLQIKENGEKYMMLGPKEHICEAVKHDENLESEGKIINASDFITISQADGKVTRVIVFTTSERNECYEFSYTKTKDQYRCLGCKSIQRHVTVKLCTNENGQEFLQMSLRDHECIPRKYKKEKFLQNGCE